MWPWLLMMLQQQQQRQMPQQGFGGQRTANPLAQAGGMFPVQASPASWMNAGMLAQNQRQPMQAQNPFATQRLPPMFQMGMPSTPQPFASGFPGQGQGQGMPTSFPGQGKMPWAQPLSPQIGASQSYLPPNDFSMGGVNPGGSYLPPNDFSMNPIGGGSTQRNSTLGTIPSQDWFKSLGSGMGQSQGRQQDFGTGF